jgi:hypothetical protein
MSTVKQVLPRDSSMIATEQAMLKNQIRLVLIVMI